MERLTVGSFGGGEKEMEMRVVEVKIKRHPLEEEIVIEALEIDMISKDTLPSPPKSIVREVKALGLTLADDLTQYHKTTAPLTTSLLVGADYYWEIVTGRTKRLQDKVMAAETILGWTLHGPTQFRAQPMNSSTVMVLKVTTTKEDINEEVKRFWELESIGISDNMAHTKTTDNDGVHTYIKDTMAFRDGRYEVRLPWKEHVTLEENKSVAEKRLSQVTKKLLKDPKNLQAYDKAIREYIESGIAEKVSTEEDKKRKNFAYYMPHQAVIKEDRATTKIRIVFDASASRTAGRSLNDNLEIGPNLNPDIASLLMNFRQHKIAMAADVEKAFLQIAIHEEDRDALRFLWWKEIPNKDSDLPTVETWRMKRVTFGTKPSSFLLAATIHHHLDAVREKFPNTVGELKKGIYVDDVFLGAEDTPTAATMYNEARSIFAAAGMNLRKWTSSDPTLRTVFDKEGEDLDRRLRQEGKTKVLGMKWNFIEDQITFPSTAWRSDIDVTEITKRQLLQATARLYDPLGLLTPFSVRAKLQLQNVWKESFTWDDPLPDGYRTACMEWISELEVLDGFSLPRCSHPFGKAEQLSTLHVFSDASPRAYGAAAYLVTTYTDGSKNTQLLMSKGRVAPLKDLTLARVELLAATIAARLAKYIVDNFVGSIKDVKFWTDSQIVLCWVKSSKLKDIFVQNRVHEIKRKSSTNQWGYVKSEENPADLMTRGIKLKQLLASEAWWKGPVWLIGSRERPAYEAQINDMEENDVVNMEHCMLTSCDNQEKLIDVSRFGSYTKALKIAAWVLRYAEKLRKNKTSGPITAEELNKAELFLIRQEQKELMRTGETERNGATERKGASQLHGVGIFKDTEGVIRVKGRLERSDMSFDEKHPIVLPKKSKLSELLVRHVHHQTMHGGVCVTLTRLRTKFWVVQGRQLVRMIIRRCITCRRFNARPMTQEMAPLPADRITQSSPFEVIGVDFAGPLYAGEERGHTEQKMYIVIFTCAVTRAVHLELMKSTSSECFIHAFRRFVARRGMCKTIYSDNARSFRRSEKEINKILRMEDDKVRLFTTNLQIKWKYIAELAPWWGGFYERLIRSFKSAIRKTIGRRLMTEEQLRTIVVEAEGVLNNRPLTYVYDDPNEPLPITPADVIGGRQRLHQEPTATETCLGGLWKNSREGTAAWWERWQREYLAELRSASLKSSANTTIKEGDIVLLGDKTHRAYWKLCNVEKIFPGRDGLVRACLLKTPDRQLIRRPVQLLYSMEGCYN